MDKPLDFGDYCLVEMRGEVGHPLFLHKVIGRIQSNTWSRVPFRRGAETRVHNEIEDVLLCLCCGVAEDRETIQRFREKDVKRSDFRSVQECCAATTNERGE